MGRVLHCCFSRLRCLLLFVVRHHRLPKYSTKELMKTKLMLAIHCSPTMDADVQTDEAQPFADLA